MTRSELKENIMNICTDPWTDGDQTYSILKPEEAQHWLQDTITTQILMDLDPEECIPEDMDPALFLELWNEIATEHNRELREARLAKYITENCCVAEYDSFRLDYYTKYNIFLPEVVPMEWLNEDDDPFELNALPVSEMIKLVRNSPAFSLKDEYYTLMNGRLISTNNPFVYGISNAKKMARFLVNTNEDYGNDDFRKILNGEEVE